MEHDTSYSSSHVEPVPEGPTAATSGQSESDVPPERSMHTPPPPHPLGIPGQMENEEGSMMDIAADDAGGMSPRHDAGPDVEPSSPFTTTSAPTISEVMISTISTAILTWQMQHPMETGTIDWDAVAAVLATSSRGSSNGPADDDAEPGFAPSASLCKALWEGIDATIPPHVIQPLEELYPQTFLDEKLSSSLMGPASVTILHPLTRPDTTGDDPCVFGLVSTAKASKPRAPASSVLANSSSGSGSRVTAIRATDSMMRPGGFQLGYAATAPENAAAVVPQR